MGRFTNSILAVSALDARLDESILRGIAAIARFCVSCSCHVITRHVIEALLSDGVEPVE
jgi:hypothetical protein